MNWLKRLTAVVCSGVIAFGCLGLGGCGEQAAATWSHGKILEDEVTESIESMRSYYGLDEDDSSWESYLEEKSYDSDAEEDESSGTAADLRAYVIEQLAEEDILEYEVEQQDIEVTDEEVDEYVETMRQYIEASFAEGTFESYLQVYMGYDSVEAYEEDVRKTLAEEKLKDQVVAEATEDDSDSEDADSTDEESTEDTDADSTDEESTEDTDADTTDEESTDEDADSTDEDADSADEVDEDAIWDEYVDGLVEDANLKIKDMPSGLSYDPASWDTEDTEDSEDTDEESTDDTDATETDTADEESTDEESADATEDTDASDEESTDDTDATETEDAADEEAASE